MDKNIADPTLIKYLTRATFIFLLVPYLIFFFGWLHWWVAVPITVICVLPVLWDWRQPDEVSMTTQAREKGSISLRQLVFIGSIGLLFILISGIGGWGWQNVDWDKHNTLLKDLIEQPWPVAYQFDGTEMPLVYYVAYYLPAALIGKAFGWVTANQALLIESWLGLWLTFLWGYVLIKQSWWKAVLFVACFAGMDILGYLLMAPVAPIFLGEGISIYDFEWWSIGWSYPSFTRVLFWTPNQGFAGWLATAVIVYEMFNRERKYTIWYLGLTILWSPFITLGLLPFVLADGILNFHALAPWIRKYGLPNLCGALLGSLIGFMYLAKFYPLPPEVSGEITAGFIFALTDNSTEVIAALIFLVLFWLLECGLYGVLAWKVLDPADRQSRLGLTIGLIFLAFLPLYQYGYYNDLVQKASIPALFALTIIIGRAAWSRPKRRGVHRALTALLTIGVMTAFVNIGIQLEGIVRNRALWQLPPSSEVSTLWQLQEKEQQDAFEIEGLEYTSFISQYIGSAEAPFFQWLVRQ